jgi:hypothetical protein
VDALVTGVDAHIVVLIAVARIDHDGLIQVVDGEIRAEFAPRIVVGAVGEGEELELFAGDQVFDDMSPAIAEVARIMHVGRIVVA